MRHTKALAALTILAGTTWSGPTLAQTPDPVVVEVGERLVTGQTESVHVDQPLPAGTWTMTVETSDGYEGRDALTAEQKARQSSERVTVLGHTTGDLDDTVGAASAADTFTVELAEAVDHFVIRHAGTGVDWDSVNVDRVTFTPITAPELVPVTTVPPLEEHPAPTIAEPAPTTTPTTAPQPQLPEARPAVPVPVEQVPYTG